MTEVHRTDAHEERSHHQGQVKPVDELEKIYQQQKIEIARRIAQKKQPYKPSESRQDELDVSDKVFIKLENFQEWEWVSKHYKDPELCILQICTAWMPSRSKRFEFDPNKFPQVRFFKMDLDKNMPILVKYQLEQVPAFLFTRSGRIVGRVVYPVEFISQDKHQELLKMAEQEDLDRSAVLEKNIKDMLIQVQANNPMDDKYKDSDLVDYIKSQHEPESKEAWLLNVCNFLEHHPKYWPHLLELAQDAAVKGQPSLEEIAKQLLLKVDASDAGALREIAAPYLLKKGSEELERFIKRLGAPAGKGTQLGEMLQEISTSQETIDKVLKIVPQVIKTINGEAKIDLKDVVKGIGQSGELKKIGKVLGNLIKKPF